jgi:DNA helicase-2/ATP-dependent DNA helicase PcrA
MGVSAVPGSGKTFTLSALAAQLVLETPHDDEQEVLVVTLVNSAVDNFRKRTQALLEEQGLVPHVGFRVRTLHGLAHDIVRERPDLVGLSEGFDIADERVSNQILQSLTAAWARRNQDSFDDVISEDLAGNRAATIRREQWPALVTSICDRFIRQAKDLEVTPGELQDRIHRLLPQPLPLAEMGLAVYADYQRSLSRRGSVDFSDLVRLALRALRTDADLLERLRHRWHYILEDEAQDSSELQESILRLLAGESANWVRVGDPNQAIYESFTTASPRLLRAFLDDPRVAERELPNSGRSTMSIMRLANYLIDWTRSEHPVPALRDALALPHMEPTPPGDPQGNPPEECSEVHLYDRELSPAREVETIVRSVERWLAGNPHRTVAILVPRNDRGVTFSAQLKARKIPYVEYLRTTQATRQAAGAVANVVNYLASPKSARRLAQVYRVWRRGDRDDESAADHIQSVSTRIARWERVEEFAAPLAGGDWMAGLEDAPLDAGAADAELGEFRRVVRRWQAASVLPIDELVLTIAQDLFDQATDLAVAHKLAALLRQMQNANPSWRLPALTRELADIARNRRRFLGLGPDDTGFDPEAHKGRVVVTTAHKAKGLEWDRVYVTAVNDYNFPSALASDQYIGERWYVRDGLNLEAEALAQLDALIDGAPYVEGAASRQARLEYAAERLRLLYVGITRAKTELVITWNTGRHGNAQPAVPFVALSEHWKRAHKEAT